MSEFCHGTSYKWISLNRLHALLTILSTYSTYVWVNLNVGGPFTRCAQTFTEVSMEVVNHFNLWLYQLVHETIIDHSRSKIFKFYLSFDGLNIKRETTYKLIRMIFYFIFGKLVVAIKGYSETKWFNDSVFEIHIFIVLLFKSIEGRIHIKYAIVVFWFWFWCNVDHWDGNDGFFVRTYGNDCAIDIFSRRWRFSGIIINHIMPFFSQEKEIGAIANNLSN